MNFQFLKKLNLNKLLIITGTTVLVFVVIFIIWWNKEILINNGIGIINKNETPKSLITGLDCPDADVGSITVMLASAPEASPISGISRYGY